MDAINITMDTINGSNGGTWIFLHQITYGEMIIAILLVLVIALIILKIFIDVLRTWW